MAENKGILHNWSEKTEAFQIMLIRDKRKNGSINGNIIDY